MSLQAWAILRAASYSWTNTDFLKKLGDAIDRFRSTLQAYAASLGASGKYHETITIAWLLLIAERLDAGARPLTWREFADRHPELFGAPSLVIIKPA